MKASMLFLGSTIVSFSIVLSATAAIAPEARRAHPATPFRRTVGKLGGNIEHLTGADGRRYMENLRSRHPGVFERAAADLKNRGYKDTGDIEVFRTVRTARNRFDKHRGPNYLVDTLSSSEGEIVYWAWDDGDPTTWEGSVYLLEYTSGNWIDGNCQTYVDEGREWTETWHAFIDAGGPGIDRGPYQTKMHPPRDSGGDVLFAVASSVPAAAQDVYLVRIDWLLVQRKWEDWSWCTAFGCAGTTVACYSLPGTPQQRAACAAATCLGIGIGCLFVLR